MPTRKLGTRKHLDAAAASLQYYGIPVYMKTLAEVAKVPENTLRHVICFQRPQWRAELSIVDGHSDSWNKSLIYGLYGFAAKLLLSEDLLPAPTCLGEMLELTPHHVRNY